jgi:hypothetical protein
MVSLLDARNFIIEFEHVAQVNGYFLAVYGSVVRYGVGRNLDVVAVPVTPLYNYGFMVAQMRDRGCTQVGEAYRGAMGTLSIILDWRGITVDLQVREVPRE